MSIETLWKSGTILIVSNESKTLSCRIIVENKGKNAISVAKPESPYNRLTFAQNGFVSFRDGNEKGCILTAKIVCKHRNCYTIQSSLHGLYVSFNSLGDFVSTPEQTILYLIEDNGNDCMATAALQASNSSAYTSLCVNAYLLKGWERRRFVSEGYLLCPNAVNNAKVNTAVAVLNHYLGVPEAIVPGGIQGGELGKFAGGITLRPEITSLFEGSVQGLVESLLGQRDSADKASLCPQVAFRFPELGCHHSQWAIDGKKWHTDGFRQGKAHSFSLLVGVCLSDVTGPFQGNLVVWPGTHVAVHASKVGPYGAIDTVKLSRLLASEGCSSSEPNTLPPPPHQGNADASLKAIDETDGNDGEEQGRSSAIHDNEPEDLPELGAPVQLLMKAGDVVLLHPDSPHLGGPNYCHHIRMMVYFRVKNRKVVIVDDTAAATASAPPLVRHASWEQVEAMHLKDMWVDLEGSSSTL